MKLENQVSTIDESIRLKELGIAQQSYFYHMRWDSAYAPREYDVVDHNTLSDCKENPITYPEFYSAFTVAELGVMLPTGFDSMRSTKDYCKDGEGWATYTDDGIEFPTNTWLDTEASSRSQMIIHLIQMELVDVDDLNNRLLKS